MIIPCAYGPIIPLDKLLEVELLYQRVWKLLRLLIYVAKVLCKAYSNLNFFQPVYCILLNNKY